MPEIDAEVLRFVFGDLLYDMSDNEKSDLRKRLVIAKKNIGARKVRMAVNASIGADLELRGRLRDIYVQRATHTQKMIGKVLMLTIPEVSAVAQAYFSNAKDFYTVGEIAEISELEDQRNNISQSIGRFLKKRRGIIQAPNDNGISLEAVDVGGQAGSAYRFLRFSPSEVYEGVDVVFVVQPADGPSFSGNAEKVYNQVASQKNRGVKTIYHRLLRKESVGIYKIKDGLGRWTEIEPTPEGGRVRHVDAPASTK